MSVLASDPKVSSSAKGQSKKLLWKGHKEGTDRTKKSSERPIKGRRHLRVHLKGLTDDPQLPCGENYCVWNDARVHISVFVARDFNTTMQQTSGVQSGREKETWRGNFHQKRRFLRGGEEERRHKRVWGVQAKRASGLVSGGAPWHESPFIPPMGRKSLWPLRAPSSRLDVSRVLMFITWTMTGLKSLLRLHRRPHFQRFYENTDQHSTHSAGAMTTKKPTSDSGS